MANRKIKTKTAKQIRRQVKKSLKSVRSSAIEEAVHHLRTGLRRCEALASGPLPKPAKKLRRQAGRVRDCDVLLKLLNDLELATLDRASSEKLKTAIEERRARFAATLVSMAGKVRVSKLKKWSGEHVAQPVHGMEKVLSDFHRIIEAPDYANLGQHNLHDFRLDIKPLRYRAEMFKGVQADGIARRLNAIQSAIGDWHDLMLLSDFAEQVFAGSDNAVFKKIRSEVESSYDDCLHATLRQKKALSEIRLRSAK